MEGKRPTCDGRTRHTCMLLHPSHPPIMHPGVTLSSPHAGPAPPFSPLVVNPSPRQPPPPAPRYLPDLNSSIPFHALPETLPAPSPPHLELWQRAQRIRDLGQHVPADVQILQHRHVPDLLPDRGDLVAAHLQDHELRQPRQYCRQALDLVVLHADGTQEAQLVKILRQLRQVVAAGARREEEKRFDMSKLLDTYMPERLYRTSLFVIYNSHNSGVTKLGKDSSWRVWDWDQHSTDNAALACPQQRAHGLGHQTLNPVHATRH